MNQLALYDSQSFNLYKYTQHTVNCNPPVQHPLLLVEQQVIPIERQARQQQPQHQSHHVDNILIQQPISRNQMIGFPLQQNDTNMVYIFINNFKKSQAVLEDFHQNNKKFYWVKEFQNDRRGKWVKKVVLEQLLKNLRQLVPPLPEKTVQGMLQIPWNQIKTMEFPTKQTWFRLNLEKHRVPWQQGSDTLHVTRDSFLMSTLGSINGINWHKEVKVIIEDEKVLDAGGLLREWTNLIMKEIIHPESGMFEIAETEDVSYKINSNADVDEHVLDCFRLLGTVVGKAIFERNPINAYLDRTIIRHMLGQQITLEDFEYYDRQLYQSWSFMLNNSFDPQDLMEAFVLYRKGRGDVYELKQGGANILVDDSNKQEYIQLWQGKIFQIFKQFGLLQLSFSQAILVKFFGISISGLKIVPKKLLSIFDPAELEMILYGIPFINLEDWRENTEYKGAYYRTHQTIVWQLKNKIILKRFWECLGEFDQPLLGKFLQFCTGSSRTPVEGFRQRKMFFSKKRKLESNRGNCSKFCIESIPLTIQNPYPKAHTCFNRLELPMQIKINKTFISYESKEDLQTYIKAIVNNDLDCVFGLE